MSSSSIENKILIQLLYPNQSIFFISPRYVDAFVSLMSSVQTKTNFDLNLINVSFLDTVETHEGTNVLILLQKNKYINVDVICFDSTEIDCRYKDSVQVDRR